jgi:hypothetical protein
MPSAHTTLTHRSRLIGYLAAVPDSALLGRTALASEVAIDIHLPADSRQHTASENQTQQIHIFQNVKHVQLLQNSNHGIVFFARQWDLEAFDQVA